MTGPTHRVYSVCFAFIAAMILYNSSITQVNYYLVLIILLAFSRRGALFPDLDHNWQNIGEKTVPNKIINTLIHITGGKHRSWQTHSLDICIWFTVLSVIIPNKLFKYEIISEVNKEVSIVILLGFASGWISHMFSDMLNGTGIRLICFLKNSRIALVPHKIGKLRFNTGHEWEAFNFKIISIINKILGIICIIYPLIAKGYINKIIAVIGGF